MSRDRKHIRLKGWDYSSEGIYFITICCFDRQNFFGEIYDNKIQLSEIGYIASQYWFSIPSHFPQVRIDEFVIMPDHIHGIIFINDNPARTSHGASLQDHTNKFSKPLKGSLSVIINQYKSSVTKWCKTHGHQKFKWQSRFYDHILRDEESLDSLRTYIRTNPLTWQADVGKRSI